MYRTKEQDCYLHLAYSYFNSGLFCAAALAISLFEVNNLHSSAKIDILFVRPALNNDPVKKRKSLLLE